MALSLALILTLGVVLRQTWSSYTTRNTAPTASLPTPDQVRRYQRPSAVPYPAENPWSAAKEALGQSLFFDPILSGHQTIACSSCHQPGAAWADNQATSISDQGRRMPTRTPSLLNSAWTTLIGWTGSFANIEAVTQQALTAEHIMNLPMETALQRLSESDVYQTKFKNAYGPESITKQNLLDALGTYVRGLTSRDAAFDRWIAGDAGAISKSAQRGFALFEGKAECASCHQGWSFTDGSFADNGISRSKDIGRGALFPASKTLQFSFKTPTLRALQAPFMHDGSLPTLEAVVAHYNDGGINRPSRPNNIHPLHLSDSEQSDLVAFLRTLNDASTP